MVTPQSINDMLKEQWPAARGVCTEVGPKHAVAALTPQAFQLRPGGYISGPTLFAAADAALWFLCFGAIGQVEPRALTSDLSIRFLRPADGQTIFARADLNKASRRSVIGTVTIWTDSPEEHCATAQGAYILPAGMVSGE